MILYFSATGNTKFAAEMIAEKLGDKTLSLTERIKTHNYSEIFSSKPFVICSPIYVFEMPAFMIDFLKNVVFSGSKRIYFVFTCGSNSGIAGGLARTISRKKNMLYMGSSDIIMPNNYIASTLFPENPTSEKLYRIENAKLTAQKIALDIKNKRQLKSRYILFCEKAAIVPFAEVWTRTMQSSEPFYVTDKCIGCGKCVKVCPLNNITQNASKRPEWQGPCAHCMACIGSCPVEAIEYGEITLNKEKYNIRKYLPQIKES